MKKIKEKQYAELLYEITDNISGEALKKVLKKFIVLLAKKRDLKRINRIIDKFSETYNNWKNLEEVQIITSKKISEKTLAEIKRWLEKQLSRKIKLEEKIDETLLGGLIVKYQDTVLDMSLKNNLNNLKISLIE